MQWARTEDTIERSGPCWKLGHSKTSHSGGRANKNLNPYGAWAIFLQSARDAAVGRGSSAAAVVTVMGSHGPWARDTQLNQAPGICCMWDDVALDVACAIQGDGTRTVPPRSTAAPALHVALMLSLVLAGPVWRRCSEQSAGRIRGVARGREPGHAAASGGHGQNTRRGAYARTPTQDSPHKEGCLACT